MVQLGYCRACRKYASEVWSRKDSCTGCGGVLEHLRVDMGGVEWVPKAFNLIGVASFVGALALIFYYLIMASDAQSLLTVCMVLFAIGGIMFAASLLSQMYVSNLAIRNKEMESPLRRTRDLREGRGREPKSGPMPPQERKTPPTHPPYQPGRKIGKKILLNK